MLRTDNCVHTFLAEDAPGSSVARAHLPASFAAFPLTLFAAPCCALLRALSVGRCRLFLLQTQDPLHSLSEESLILIDSCPAALKECQEEELRGRQQY